LNIGLPVMLGDSDAGGVITYAQTGATYGLSLFIPLMIPLAFMAYLVQEMTIRLGVPGTSRRRRKMRRSRMSE
jgi:Mn2+/Fe2+ NRAMP family transporter